MGRHARRMNGNMQPGGGGRNRRDPLESTRDAGGEKLSGLNGGDLSQNAQHWERDLVSPPPVDRLGLKWGEGLANPQPNFSDPKLLLCKRTAGTKMEKRLREMQSSDWPNLGSISWEVGHQDLTLLLML